MLEDDVYCFDSLFENVPTVVKLPFQIIYTFSVCYFYFSWTLYASVSIILFMTATNFGMNKLWAWFNSSKYGWNDDATNKQYEIINNIKAIKLNSWINIAENDMLEGKRIAEKSMYVSQSL